MSDNAQPHASKYSREFLGPHEITIRDWDVPNSPDLNPISEKFIRMADSTTRWMCFGRLYSSHARKLQL